MEDAAFDRFDAVTSWYPVAVSHEIQPASIVQAFLGGHELALWRSADGAAHAWENRCPHRGTRFTLGRIVNDMVTCAYHGWRFDRQGQCSLIPANPDLAPPRNACAKTFPVREMYGMVWATLGDMPWLSPELDDITRTFCRSFVIYSSPEATCAALLRHWGHRCEKRGNTTLIVHDSERESSIVFMQPMKRDRTIAHLWFDAGSSKTTSTEQIKAAAAVFKSLRTGIELVQGEEHQ